MWRPCNKRILGALASLRPRGRRAQHSSAALISPAPSQLRRRWAPHRDPEVPALGPPGDSMAPVKPNNSVQENSWPWRWAEPVSQMGPQQGHVHPSVTAGPSAGPCARLPAISCSRRRPPRPPAARLPPGSTMPSDTAAGAPETDCGRTARSGSWRPLCSPSVPGVSPLRSLSALCRTPTPMLRVVTGHPQQATRTPKPCRPSEAVPASARGAGGPGGCLAQPRGRQDPCLWGPGTGLTAEALLPPAPPPCCSLVIEHGKYLLLSEKSDIL